MDICDVELTENQLGEIQRLSERCGVRELALFGSVLHADRFGPASDVDVAVTFRETKAQGRFAAYMELKEALERLFRRPVDLVSANAVRNSFFRRELDESRKILYAASS